MKMIEIASELMTKVRRRCLYSFWWLTIDKIKNMMNSRAFIKVGLDTETKKSASKTNLLIWTIMTSTKRSLYSWSQTYALLKAYLILPLVVVSLEGSAFCLFY